MILYSIRDWDNRYETHDTRKLKSLKWVLVPNRFDSVGLIRIKRQKDSALIFSGWILLLELASKCDPRGTLVHDGIPLSPEDAGELTGFPVEIFKRALSFLATPEIGWIIAKSFENSQSPGMPGESTVDPGCSTENLPLNRKESKVKERKVSVSSFFPEDFSITEEIRIWAKRKGYRSPESLFDKFKLYHKSKGSKFKDWYSAFQNWIIKDAEYNPINNNTGPKTITMFEMENMNRRRGGMPELTAEQYAEFRKSRENG
jgi:hypothetical protein